MVAKGSSSIQPIINDIRMVSLTDGWAIAADGEQEFVLRTSDSGRTWRDVTPPIESWSPDVISGGDQQAILGEGYFFDEQRAWLSTRVIYLSYETHTSAVGRAVLSTRDAGETWSVVSFPDDPGVGYGSFVDFIDPLHGWFAIYEYIGAGGNHLKLYRTSDGGASWNAVVDDFFTEGWMSPIMDFANAQVGLMVFPRSYYVDGPYVRWSRDGGITWEDSQDLPVPADSSPASPAESSFDCGTNLPYAFSDVEAVVVVECRTDRDGAYDYRSFFYSTGDGGQSWRSVPLPSSSRLFLLDRNAGWVLGRDIFRTLDAGRSWTKVKTVAWDGQFSFVDKRHGWAVARSGDEIALVKTDDGGSTWYLLKPQLEP